MGRALSLDLRERVTAAVAGGLSRRRAAERFGVSAASPLERIGTVDRQSGGEASGRGSSVGADRGACRYDPLDG